MWFTLYSYLSLQIKETVSVIYCLHCNFQLYSTRYGTIIETFWQVSPENYWWLLAVGQILICQTKGYMMFCRLLSREAIGRFHNNNEMNDYELYKKNFQAKYPWFHIVIRNKSRHCSRKPTSLFPNDNNKIKDCINMQS